MFDSEPGRDRDSRKVTRRVFVAGGAVAAGGLALFSMRKEPTVEASGAVDVPKTVTIVNFSDDGKNLGSQTMPQVVKTDEQWLAQLGKNSFDIARRADTEIPYTGVNWNEHRKGTFRCVGCNLGLFSSSTKFDSGTGWPSFWAPLAKENVAEVTDNSLGIERTEVKCKRCNAHLGHVFPDGPPPTGLRYCMNSGAMKFVPA